MDSQLFIESFRSLNTSFVKLVDALSALRELSALPVHKQQEAALLDSVLQVLMTNQDLERCSIFLLEEGRLVNVAGLDWNDLIGSRTPGEKRTPISFAIGEGVVGVAAARQELLHCRDCAQDPHFSDCCSIPLPETPKELRDSGMVGSILSVPIIGNDEVLGVLNVSHPHTHFFNETHERALVIFCNVLGQLLLNNRLVRHMNDLVTERTRQLETALDEAEELKRNYAELSVVDELTTLYNRRFFFPEARASLARAMRYQLPFSLLLLDIDHFKQVNDNYGHATGDEVLRDVASLFRERLREGDLLARFGGEEFIIALPNTDQAGAMRLAEQIRRMVKEMSWQQQGRSLKVSLCVGVSTLNPGVQGDSEGILERMMAEADQALYFGKQNGRDQSCAFGDIACDVLPAQPKSD